MRDLGALGEDTFRLWCTQAGLIPNSSQIDKTGWDFHIESSNDYQTLLSEVHSAPIEYRVQVKASDKRKRSLAIPLSNLWRMATLQMPTYYAFLEFDGLNVVQNAYLVHLDSELVGKILKRLHENDQRVQPSELHKSTFTIKYNDEHKLEELSGDALSLMLNKPVKNDMAKYIADKKHHLETIGYDDYVYSLSFSLDEEGAANLVESSLGMGTEAKILSPIMRKKRFGIYGKKPIFEHESAIVKIEPKPSNGKAIFRESHYAASLSFDVSLFIPAIVDKRLGAEYKKLRFESELFDILWFTDKLEARFEFKLKKEVEIRQLSKFLKLTKLLQSGVEIELEIEELERPVLFQLQGTDDALLSELDKQRESIKQIQQILDIYDFEDSINLSFDNVSALSRVIPQFLILLTANETGTSRNEITIEFKNSGALETKEGKTISISSASIIVGDFLFGTVFSVKGDYERIGSDTYKLSSNDVICEDRFVINKKHVEASDIRQKAVDTIIKKYDAEDYDVIHVPL